MMKIQWCWWCSLQQQSGSFSIIAMAWHISSPRIGECAWLKLLGIKMYSGFHDMNEQGLNFHVRLVWTCVFVSQSLLCIASNTHSESRKAIVFICMVFYEAHTFSGFLRSELENLFSLKILSFPFPSQSKAICPTGVWQSVILSCHSYRTHMGSSCCTSCFIFNPLF